LNLIRRITVQFLAIAIERELKPFYVKTESQTRLNWWSKPKKNSYPKLFDMLLKYIKINGLASISLNLDIPNVWYELPQEIRESFIIGRLGRPHFRFWYRCQQGGNSV
jgi:hypothetical protein